MDPETGSDQNNAEGAYGVHVWDEMRGCAILDSGATTTGSSVKAAEEIQMDRLNQSEPGEATLHDSDRRFRVANGGISESQKMLEMPSTSGLLTGETINMHLIDTAGNRTAPLLGIDEMRRLRMVIDYEENKVMFKDNPDVWHKLPVSRKGLLLLPLTK